MESRTKPASPDRALEADFPAFAAPSRRSPNAVPAPRKGEAALSPAAAVAVIAAALVLVPAAVFFVLDKAGDGEPVRGAGMIHRPVPGSSTRVALAPGSPAVAPLRGMGPGGSAPEGQAPSSSR